MPFSSDEQDKAVGGPGRRCLQLSDGSVVVASVAVRSFAVSPNQCYGYLQFKTNNKTVTKYIGKVTAANREESLRIGWSLVRSRKLAEAQGWTWMNKSR